MKTPIILLIPILLASCASIVSGTSQKVTLNSTPESGASCTLTNSQGSWKAQTPATLEIHKAYADLKMECAKKDNNLTGLTTVESKVKLSFWGNILFGGLIGMGIDGYNGAGFEYPADISVPLGKKS